MIAPRVAAIPGTVIFDSVEAQKGYALNRMCYSFNHAENRAAFLADEDAYCARFLDQIVGYSHVRNFANHEIEQTLEVSEFEFIACYRSR